MSAVAFDPNDPKLTPEVAGLLLKLDKLTERLEGAVLTLERHVGTAVPVKDPPRD